MSNYEIHIKPQIDYKKYGFIKGRSSKDWVILGNVKNIYFSEKDYVLHFNKLTLECVSKIIDMAKDDVICCVEKTKSKKHCMNLDDEEYKLIIENRKKFKNTEGQK